jgi:hypothetical protein
MRSFLNIYLLLLSIEITLRWCTKPTHQRHLCAEVEVLGGRVLVDTWKEVTSIDQSMGKYYERIYGQYNERKNFVTTPPSK